MQAIVSSALSKAGKSVLHLDKNDFYGGEDHATYSLTQFLHICNSRKSSVCGDDNVDNTCSDPPSTKDILDKLETCGHSFDRDLNIFTWKNVSKYNASEKRESVKLVDCSLNVIGAAEKKTDTLLQVRRAVEGSPVCFGYLMEKIESEEVINDHSFSREHPCFFGYQKDKKMTFLRMMQHSRQFNIDSMPKLLLSAGKMVDMIIASGVGHYLEFKSVDSLYYVSSSKQSTIMHRVPSSKSDIFNSKMFSALEKRMLMKLMQAAVDLGRRQEGLPVETLNETELAQGRALFRPQNKDTKFSGLSVDAIEAHPEKSFREFLKDSSVNATLVPFVTHGLSLEPYAECSASRALDSLYRHINASGRYGQTSFLMPIYGTSEFTQAFCRLSAVWGGVFVLRDTVDCVFVTKEKDASTTFTGDVTVRAVKLHSGKTVACSHIVCDDGADTAYLWKQNLFAQDSDSDLSQSRDGGASGVAMWRLVQRHVFSDTSILPVDTESATGDDHSESTKGVIIIPPNTEHLGNAHAVYVVQLDSSAMVSPPGVFILYLMTYIDPSGDEEQDSATSAQLMERATALLKTISGNTGAGSKAGNAVCEGFNELMFSTFLHPPVPRLETSNEAWSTDLQRKYPSNVVPCDSRRENVMYIHEAAVQAEAIFRRICPDLDMFADREDVLQSMAMASQGAEEDAELAGLDAILSSVGFPTANTKLEPVGDPAKDDIEKTNESGEECDLAPTMTEDK